MAEEVAEAEQQQDLTYKLVPWLSWDEWNFIRQSLFSSSPNSIAAALKRISAWRARGRLPIPIEVTADIIEIQQKDLFFRDGRDGDALDSDEILAMSYCMAIMRLVNGFLDKSCKESKISIAQSAEAIGIPRMLVDIRHEGSHRGLPSLPLVRTASLKALDWLKSYYWEPQKNLIPDVREETKSRIREMTLCLNAKKARQRGSTQSKRKRVKHSNLLCGRNRLFPHVARMLRCSKDGGLPSKGFKNQNSILGSLIRLYSVFPSNVVAVLLGEFLLKSPDSSDDIEVGNCSVDSQVDTNSSLSDSKTQPCTINDWKAIITILSSKEPALLLTMLEEVLVMIETRETTRFEIGEHHLPLLQYRAEIRQIEQLLSLIPWLIKNLKDAKNSDVPQSKNDNYSDAIADDNLSELLHKCLLLVTPSNHKLLHSALLLAKLIGKKSITERLKKLPLQDAPNANQVIEDSTGDLERVLQQEEDSISQAKKKLEFLKSRQIKGSTVIPEATDDSTEGKAWNIAKSWSKCPIGMLPRAFGTSGVLPVLEIADGQQQENRDPVVNEDLMMNNCTGKRGAGCDVEFLENPSGVKKMKETAMGNGEMLDFRDDVRYSVVGGQLMVGGVWKKVGEEELVAIESGVRILV